MKVRLISKTHFEQDILNEILEYNNTNNINDLEGTEIERVLAYTARVSSPENQRKDSIEKLLGYCIKNKHWSILELADLCFEVETSIAIATQIIRHSFKIQQFCLSGDNYLYFDMPSAVKNKTHGLYKITIKDFYDKWHYGAKPIPHKDSKVPIIIPMQDRLRKMYVRSYDTINKKFTHTHINDIIFVGKKDVFEVLLHNGKKIKCTKEHRFLTNNGWMTLEDATNLQLKNNKVVFDNNVFLAINGIKPYRSYELLKESKNRCIENKTGVQGMASEFGVSYHTIRKWLKKLNLSFSKKEVASYCETWNKGKRYKKKPHTDETRRKLKQSAKKGSENHLWKGGADRTFRKEAQDYVNSFRTDLLRKANEQCEMCQSKTRLELHHIIPVSLDKSKAFDLDNIQVLCYDCHLKIHNKRNIKENNYIRNDKTALFCRIENITYIGEEDVYDISVESEHQNFVCNGIVTHNSQRYQDVNVLGQDLFEPILLRRQDTKNRQNSFDDIPFDVQDEFQIKIQKVLGNITELYNEMLDAGFAKECARMILPQTTKTRLYLKTDIRGWYFYEKVRLDPSTQLEHRMVAEAILPIFAKEVPSIAKIEGWI